MELKITGSLVLELSDYIHAVEAVAGPYMLPNTAGWYLPGEVEPVLDSNKSYFYAGAAIDNVAAAIPVDLRDPRQEDIYNQLGDLVVLKKQVRFLRSEPVYSPRSCKLVIEVLDHLVRSHAKWSGTQAKLQPGVSRSNTHAAIRPFLLEPLQVSGISLEGFVQTNELEIVRGHIRRTSGKQAASIEIVSPQEKANFYAAQDICESIMLQLEGLVQLLTGFLGQDRWIMHFMKVKNTQVTVEKTIDYRIYSWMMEHGRDYDD